MTVDIFSIVKIYITGTNVTMKMAKKCEFVIKRLAYYDLLHTWINQSLLLNK